MRKKRVLIHSNSHSAFTGFGKVMKNVLLYLYKTNKYDLFELANGCSFSSKSYDLIPWKVYGSIPEKHTDIPTPSNKNEQDGINRFLGYGLYGIDKVIELVKPDIYIGIEDIWAFQGIIDKPWWNKINCMIWTTLDSIPLMPDSISWGKKINNYYVWATFAEEALKKAGVNHAKTLHGPIDCKNFHPLKKEEKSLLRKKFNIKDNTFIAGYVFRNQLRKTVGDLFDGLKLFKSQHPNVESKALIHTSWKEGWNIPELIKTSGLSNSDVLTTYVCSSCKHFTIKNFGNPDEDCPQCKSKLTFSTSNISTGITERQLNQIYNLMDIYVHPFTSGGQELPIQEAKLAGVITACTNYSCGTDMCNENSGGIPLEWTPYREIGTNFIKASTLPKSICNAMSAVYSMTETDISLVTEKARQYIIDNYSTFSIGKKLESIIDNMPIIENYDYSFINRKFDPTFIPEQNSDDEKFVISLYKNMLGIDLDKNHNDIVNWKIALNNKSETRQSLYEK